MSGSRKRQGYTGFRGNGGIGVGFEEIFDRQVIIGAFVFAEVDGSEYPGDRIFGSLWLILFCA
jgi:hypothetical protein